jgi:hypothetical protein
MISSIASGVVQEDDDTVNCDMVTSLWNVSSLDPNEMPNSCVSVNITEDFLTVANDNFVEPCIWWHLLLRKFVGVQSLRYAIGDALARAQ